MVILLVSPKNKCAICHKTFYSHYCKICKRKEFGLCPSCHKRNVAHIKEIKKVA